MVSGPYSARSILHRILNERLCFFFLFFFSSFALAVVIEHLPHLSHLFVCSTVLPSFLQLTYPASYSSFCLYDPKGAHRHTSCTTHTELQTTPQPCDSQPSSSSYPLSSQQHTSPPSPPAPHPPLAEDKAKRLVVVAEATTTAFQSDTSSSPTATSTPSSDAPQASWTSDSKPSGTVTAKKKNPVQPQQRLDPCNAKLCMTLLPSSEHSWFSGSRTLSTPERSPETFHKTFKVKEMSRKNSTDVFAQKPLSPHLSSFQTWYITYVDYFQHPVPHSLTPLT